MNVTRQIISELNAMLKESKGQMQQYIAEALLQIAEAEPENAAEVTQIWAQNVQLKAAQVAVQNGQEADAMLGLLLRIGLAAAAEQILDL